MDCNDNDKLYILGKEGGLVSTAGAEFLRSMGFEPLELGVRQFHPCKGAHQRALLLP